MFGLPALTLVLVVAAWWAATTYTDIQRILLPPPADVLAELRNRPGYLTEHGQVTVIETLVGFGLAAAAGLVIGTTIAMSRIFSQMTYPWLVAFNAIPKIALAPLLIVWLGFDLEPKVAMAVLVCFFPVVLATTSGLASTPSELVELSRSLDASTWQTFVKVRFPNALPQIFIGLKLAMPLAVIGAVIGEFAGGREGLGYVINQSGGLGNTALAFAALAVLSLLSIILYYALVGVEWLLLPWVRATTS
jgi:NitT/TauT family transport system permease protein